MPRPAPVNDFGLTAIDAYDDMVNRETLHDQLAARDVAVETHELPNIVGMGGCARLLFYTSPMTGKPITVLVVPHQYDIDRYAEDYYYFEAPKDLALVGDAEQRWAELYDRCRELS